MFRAGDIMLNRKRLALIGLLFMTIIAVRFLPGCGEGLNILTTGGNNGLDWSDWSYRRSVTIANSGTTQTDYQVNVLLTTANFTFANADAGGNDLRFNYNGTSLPYWIESWTAGTSASIWVKVPSIPNPDAVIYLYYGNAGQTSAADFDDTFTKNSGFAGLAASWHMDEGSGTSLDDSSANSNDGTITNAAVPWMGDDGGKWYDVSTAGFSTGDSVIFDGSDDYVKVTDSSSLDVSNLTIALWFKADTVATTQYLVSKWLAASRGYSLFLNGTTVVFETSFDGNTYNSLNSTITVSSGTWYHLAATLSGTAKVIYINGTARGNNAVGGSLNNSNANLTLGNVNDTTLADYFDGIIDEVSIYDRALDANEVKALSRRSKYSSTVSAPSLGSEEIVP
jgi:hypothetical protein